MCVWSQWCSEAQAGGSARHNGGSWPAGRPWALDATPSWRLLQACSSPQPAPPAASAALHPAAFRPSGEGVAAGGGGAVICSIHHHQPRQLLSLQDLLVSPT